MTTGSMPHCYWCQHRIKDRPESEVPLRCRAFPRGIPKDILLSESLHEHTRPRQTGVFIFKADNSPLAHAIEHRL